MSQTASVTANDSPSADRHKEPSGEGTVLVRFGGWKALAAAGGALLLGAALTIVPSVIGLQRDRVLMRSMSADAAAEFRQVRSSLQHWQLTIGTLATGVGSFGVWRYFSRRAARAEAVGKYLTGLEVLHRTILRVGSQMGHGREVLTEMADAARRLLGLDRSVVLLLTADCQSFLVHAISGPFPPSTRTMFAVDQTPACFRAAQSGEVLLLDNADVLPPGFGLALIREIGAKAAMVVPLRIDGRPAGVMVLADARARKFSESDRRLAELLGAQTEAVLANSHLYEQARTTVAVYQRLLLQQEMLYQVAAAVYHATSFDESSRAIVERAPELLNVDGCSVLVCEDAGTVLHVVASSGQDAPSIIGRKFPLAGTAAESVLRSGQILVVNDARNVSSVPDHLWEMQRAGSVVFLPLKRAGGLPFGLLVLLRQRSGPFTDEQLRLFQVFADRAQAALENALLQEQTRSDARTKTILLRELHHRVNNNLAGIVALLSVNQPEMSDVAQRWIRRAIERIEAMARAHDLFSQGTDRVRLADLIARVPESIAVFQNAQTRILTDLDGEEISLATPKAVSLAMVLHELCSNALLHGVQAGGQVTIRAVRMDTCVSVQVCDDGVGFDPGEGANGVAVARRGGFGLQLVRELVGRELRGSLHIESGSGHGTTVSISFPMDRDEESHT